MWAVDYLRRVPEGVDISSFILGKNSQGRHIHAMDEIEEFNRLRVFKLSTRIGHALNRKVIELEYDGVKGSDKLLRTVFRGTALLFKELCDELL